MSTTEEKRKGAGGLVEIRQGHRSGTKLSGTARQQRKDEESSGDKEDEDEPIPDYEKESWIRSLDSHEVRRG